MAPSDPRACVISAAGYTGGAAISVLRQRGTATIGYVHPDRARCEALGAHADTTRWGRTPTHRAQPPYGPNQA